jgi:hypothetical protein
MFPGYFLDASTTHTNNDQNAWWRVDLGTVNTINQIIIYNRTDCCKNRLDNYRVIISTESTDTYQADFAYAPNPKAIIDFGKQGKQGRYVKIQLLGKNYLSLAEVEVISSIKEGKGDKGDKGNKGDKGGRGYQGSRGYQGDKGDKGDKGDEGDMGENGQDGDSFFTQIGSEVSLKGENDLVVTGNIKATGNIKVGNSNSQCDANNRGAIRYNTISNLLEFCNTYTWQTVSNNFSVTHWRFPEADYSRAKNKPLSVGASVPPYFESPQALIEPSDLRTAKA